ncbi:MAG: hypothetical protein EB082_13065 [Verrucomicrobia bacterium]|nr:hypothetical protein [Verrucomicrobiota bacterium]
MLLPIAALGQTSPIPLTPAKAAGDRIVDGGAQPDTEAVRVGEPFEVPVRPPALSIFRAPLPKEIGQFICEVIGDRGLAIDMIAAMPSLMPGVEPAEAVAVVQQKIIANASAGSKIKVCVVRRQ